MRRAEQPELRLEMRGGAIETNNTLEIARAYIERINEKLEDNGWGSRCIEYRGHHRSGDEYFVLIALAPIELHEWVDQLPGCSALVFRGDQVEFRLNIPINKEAREISSDTHQAVAGVIEG